MHKIFWQEWVKNYNKYGLLVNFLKLNTYLLKDFILFFNYMCVHVSVNGYALPLEASRG